MSLEKLNWIEDGALIADGFDDAIMGVSTGDGRVVYLMSLMVKTLVEVDQMNYEDALEHLWYNVVGAYVGEMTPIYVNDLI